MATPAFAAGTHVGLPTNRPPVSRGLALTHLAEVLPGLMVVDRYEMGALLGRGSTGVVLRAEDTKSGQRVAIKFLDPELAQDAATVERFRAEARAPARIGTEHVVVVYDADVSAELATLLPFDPSGPLAPHARGAVPYLVMELLEGRDLRQYLQQHGPFSAEEVCGVLGQIDATIDRAHELGIVHRDLKPANLFLTRRPDGSPLMKILDFGVAQLADASAARGLGGGLFGTPWYMAPEQAEGSVATAASDRWALALITFRLLTGESYWAPAAVPELLGQIIEGPTMRPTSVISERRLAPRARLGAKFDAWFFRACAVMPTSRFSTAVEQTEALREALAADRDA